MKSLKRIGAVLMMLAIFVAFSPVALDGEVYAAKIKLSKKTVYMAKGKTYKLKVKGTKKKVKWKSSDSSIVSVSKKGKLKAKAYGSAVITAKVKGKTLKCKVKVERKGEKNARTLRNYLLKYGKKSGSNRYIKKKTYIGDGSEGEIMEYSITASTKNKVMTFKYEEESTEPPEERTVIMKIDLITGSAAVRTGSVYFEYEDGYSIDASEDYFGDVTTAFHHTFNTGEDTVEGLFLTKYTQSIDDSDPVIETDTAVLNTENYLRPVASNLGKAFGYWNKLLASKKTLKKAKITMKTLGFTKF